jgi:hypothetical protein
LSASTWATPLISGSSNPCVAETEVFGHSEGSVGLGLFVHNSIYTVAVAHYHYSYYPRIPVRASSCSSTSYLFCSQFAPGLFSFHPLCRPYEGYHCNCGPEYIPGGIVIRFVP